MRIANAENGRTARPLIRLGGVVAFIVALGILGYASGATAVTAHGLREWLQGFSRLAPLVFIGLFVALNTLGVPVPVLVVAGGATFDLVEGAAVTLSAMTVTACLQFLLARRLGGERLRQRLGTKLVALAGSWSGAAPLPWPAAGSCPARSAS